MAGVAGFLYAAAARALAVLAYRGAPGPLGRAHAGLKLAALAASWAGLLSTGAPWIAAAAAYPALLAALAPRRLAASALAASAYPAAFIAAAAAVLSPHEPLTRDWALRVLTLAVRAYTLSLSGLLTLSTTSPLALAGLAARAPRVFDVVVLTYRAIPLTLRDSVEAAAAQRLLGKGLADALAGAALASLATGEGLAASLYARTYRAGTPRTPPEPPGDAAAGLALLAAAAASSLAAIALEAWAPG